MKGKQVRVDIVDYGVKFHPRWWLMGKGFSKAFDTKKELMAYLKQASVKE